MWKAVGLLVSGALALPCAAAERVEIGLSTNGALIQGVVVPGSASSNRTVVLIGGMNGADAASGTVRDEVRAFEKTSPAQRDFSLIAIPVANPDGTRLQFPPTGIAYREHAESHVLWRWLGTHAPDLVLVAADEDFGLARALSENAVAETGRIPARQVPAGNPEQLDPVSGGSLLALVPDDIPISAAHREINRRRARTPQQLADELAKYYGHDFDAPLYIQAIALIARIRLGNADDVKRLVEPYVDGTKDSLARPNSLVMAGHIVFTELARRTGDARYTQMVRKVADLGFEAAGQMKESMPYHDEYSDSMFMGTVIAAQAGALTGERKYFDLAARHVAFMRKIDLRADGLYRHTPLTDAAWGRGNGFPAIGLALALAEFPRSHPAYGRLLRDFQDHMAVLARYQNRDGMWRNVIDHPGAYPELTATAMIGFAMLRGVRNGWLPAAQYQPLVASAWQAVAARVGPEGHVVDACESTPKMKTLDEYLHRAAILGPDPRAGAMALMFAVEMAGLE